MKRTPRLFSARAKAERRLEAEIKKLRPNMRADLRRALAISIVNEAVSNLSPNA